MGTKGQHPTDVCFQTKYILVILPKSSCGVQMEHRSTKSTLFSPCYWIGRIYGAAIFFFFGDCVICEAECGALPRLTGQGCSSAAPRPRTRNRWTVTKGAPLPPFRASSQGGSEPAGATSDPERITSAHLD